MVSINAIVGENGLIKKAEDARLLTLLANILFDVESGIQDINIDNVLNDKTMNNTEMIEELKKQKKSIFASYSYMYGFALADDVTKLKDVEIWYNGDVYVDNYKRGKIALTSDVDRFVSNDERTKITVYDGTIEEYKTDGNLYYYYLHATKKDKFAYWMDKNGAIISIYPDTMVNVGKDREEEYTAVYDVNWQATTHRASLYNAYKANDYKTIYGLTSRIRDAGNGTLKIEADDKFLLYSLWMLTKANTIVYTRGYAIALMEVVFALDGNALYRYSNNQTTEEDAICSISANLDYIDVESNFSSTDTFDTAIVRRLQVGDTLYACFWDEAYTRPYSLIAHAEWALNKQGLKDYFASKGYENVSRVYYRAVSSGWATEQMPYGQNNKAVSWDVTDNVNVKFEGEVKFIDL